jgi:hypothetical protein
MVGTAVQGKNGCVPAAEVVGDSVLSGAIRGGASRPVLHHCRDKPRHFVFGPFEPGMELFLRMAAEESVIST